MTKDTLYCRVILKPKRNRPRTRYNAEIAIKIALLGHMPLYIFSCTSHLQVETINFYYRIYNPDRISFSMAEMNAYLDNLFNRHIKEPIMSIKIIDGNHG